MESRPANHADSADIQTAVRRIAHQLNNSLTALHCLIDLGEVAIETDRPGTGRNAQIRELLEQVGKQVQKLFEIAPPSEPE